MTTHIIDKSFKLLNSMASETVAPCYFRPLKRYILDKKLCYTKNFTYICDNNLILYCQRY